MQTQGTRRKKDTGGRQGQVLSRTDSNGAVEFNLYLITNRRQLRCGDLCAAVEKALRGGVRAVQLREKDLSARELHELASRMRDLTHRYEARLFINDRADVALAVRADGVHLGGHSMPVRAVRDLVGERLMVGVSCHGIEGALAAEEGGADFITFSPIYETPSKIAYGKPLGPELLAEAVEQLRIPVFALGGIKPEKIGEVARHGARRVAMISAILSAADPELAAREMLAILTENTKQ